MKRLIAFTLAETLVVIGIIGTVAALTLPNLNSNTGNKETVVKVKKLYSNLDDAMGRAVVAYGPVKGWFTNDNSNADKTKRLGDRLTEYMKVSKNCGMNKGCYTSGSGGSDGYEFILPDGASVKVRYIGSRDFSLGNRLDQMKDWQIVGTFYDIYVDIDGLDKGKNMAGYDIFAFVDSVSDPNSLEPSGEKRSPRMVSKSSCGDYKNGGIVSINTTCTAWVIDKDNMDYLKIKSKRLGPTDLDEGFVPMK